MASRKPLVPWNREQPRKEGGKRALKRERYLFALLSRSSLLEQMNMILRQVDVGEPPLALTEEDLLKPTPYKINQAYFACFSEVFGVSPDLSIQPSFMVEHPELMEDYVQKIQFYRLMKRFMENCAVHDFSMTDIVTPDPKRTCRNLSAIVNFIKFHVHTAKESLEQEEATAVLLNEYATVSQRNVELKKKLTDLHQQKEAEQEQEEELKRAIAQQDAELAQSRQQEDSLVKQLQTCTAQRSKVEQKKIKMQGELDKITRQLEDLRKLIVTSPEKLNARLSKLQQEVEEMKVSTRDSERLMRMWESLVSRAQHIPTALKGLNEDMDVLMAKTKKKSDLLNRLESIEEHVARQKQALREATAKHQNLIRHLKLVENESQQIVYEDQRLPASRNQCRDELERNVLQLQQEVHAIEAKEDMFIRQIGETKTMLETRRTRHQEKCAETKKMMERLHSAMQELCVQQQ